MARKVKANKQKKTEKEQIKPARVVLVQVGKTTVVYKPVVFARMMRLAKTAGASNPDDYVRRVTVTEYLKIAHKKGEINMSGTVRQLVERSLNEEIEALRSRVQTTTAAAASGTALHESAAA